MSETAAVKYNEITIPTLIGPGHEFCGKCKWLDQENRLRPCCDLFQADLLLPKKESPARCPACYALANWIHDNGPALIMIGRPGDER